MSNTNLLSDKKIRTISEQIAGFQQNIVLLFAFNGTGKTRLSIDYKNMCKDENGQHTGAYYNSYSEDLFHWFEDDECGIIFKIDYSSLNQYHSLISEDIVKEKIEVYDPKFDFEFSIYKDDTSKGIEYIRFFPLVNDGEDTPESIKISRGEQQLFIWSFFLSLLDVQGWRDKEKSYLFIDDPVSSLDDNNIFATAFTLVELIDKHYKKNKIIITTHHAVFFSILSNWLTKGEKAGKYKSYVIQRIIKHSKNELELVTFKREVFLYHLELIQTLQQAVHDDQIFNYHFAILRQVMENISSFLGSGQISYVLEQIGLRDKERIMQIVNTLSHEKIFRLQPSYMAPDNKAMFLEVFNAIMNKYSFIIHVEE